MELRRTGLFGAARHIDEHRLGAGGDFVFRLTGEIGVDHAVRARCGLGGHARAIGGEPVDEVAEAQVARIAHRFERACCRQVRGGADIGQGGAGKIGRNRLKLAACVFERLQLLDEKGVGPRTAELEAHQHVDDAESLTARVVALDARNHVLAERRDHAVDQAGQGIVHAASSSARLIWRNTGAICVAIAGIRMSLNSPCSKQRAAAICVKASFSSEKTR